MLQKAVVEALYHIQPLAHNGNLLFCRNQEKQQKQGKEAVFVVLSSKRNVGSSTLFDDSTVAISFCCWSLLTSMMVLTVT